MGELVQSHHAVGRGMTDMSICLKYQRGPEDKYKSISPLAAINGLNAEGSSHILLINRHNSHITDTHIHAWVLCMFSFKNESCCWYAVLVQKKNKGPGILNFPFFILSAAQPCPHSFQSILIRGSAWIAEYNTCAIVWTLASLLPFSCACAFVCTPSAQSQKIACTLSASPPNDENGVMCTVCWHGQPKYTVVLSATAGSLDAILSTHIFASTKVAKAEGIVQCSNSPWESPLHWSPKRRVATTHLGINDITMSDWYPVLHRHDFSVCPSRKAIFSKVNLIWGYHSVPVYHKSIPKTAFIAPFVFVLFLWMPFGLNKCGTNFSVNNGLSPTRPRLFLFVYLDDTLVASISMEQHLAHLLSLSTYLSQHGLIINLPIWLDSNRHTLPYWSQCQVVHSPVNFYHCFISQVAALMNRLYRVL